MTVYRGKFRPIYKWGIPCIIFCSVGIIGVSLFVTYTSVTKEMAWQEWMMLLMSITMIVAFSWALYAILKTRNQLLGRFELEFSDDILKVRIQNKPEFIFRIPDEIERIEYQGKEPNIFMKNGRGEFYVFNPHDLFDGKSALEQYNEIISNKSSHTTPASAPR